MKFLRCVVFFASSACMFAQAPGFGQPAVTATGAHGDAAQILSSGPGQVGLGQESSAAQSPAPQSGTAADQNQSPKAEQHADDPQTGGIGGTVTDASGSIVPGASVSLEDSSGGVHLSTTSDDNGSFEFRALKAGVPYRVTIRAKGFADWNSPAIVLNPGEYTFVKEIDLKPTSETTVTVVGSQTQIAVEQVHVEEQQRVLGFIPNFYVAYDANAVPLPAKLKFKLALRASLDPISFLGAGFLAGVDQAADTPNYVEGAKGYGQRVGAVYADGFTDLLFGGAVLPSLLHQDPRYFYQGTGTNLSRTLHALSYPFICRGDNGRLEPNYSTVGGDLISSAFSYAYYPASNRTAGLFYENFLVDTAERTVSTVVQEFVLRKLTPSARNH
jgi:hypothetical protein